MYSSPTDAVNMLSMVKLITESLGATRNVN